MRTKPVKLADLKRAQCLETGHILLFCPACCTEVSADPGDYWSVRDDYVFKCAGNSECNHRERNMILARKVTTLEEI
jgi:hypothetical protein